VKNSEGKTPIEVANDPATITELKRWISANRFKSISDFSRKA
jgi:hypothetical protein